MPLLVLGLHKKHTSFYYVKMEKLSFTLAIDQK